MRKTSIGCLAVLLLSGAVAVAHEPGGRQGGRGAGGGRGGAAASVPGLPLQASNDRSIPITKEQLQQYFKEMDARKLAALRILEGSGGKFNTGIRRISEPETATSHPITVDFWVIVEGSGTITTGGKIVDGKIVGGVSHPLKVGDVEFIPPTLPHAVTQVNGSITLLNIRRDIDWPAK
jgi:mannose-6-phosphate isomerase-like protein (cupin superfamily)